MNPMIGPRDANPAQSNHLVRSVATESGGVYFRNSVPMVEYPAGGRWIGQKKDAVWTPGFVMPNWGMDEFKALVRMLGGFGFFGQERIERIVSLYRAGLHLPIEDDADWKLLDNSVKGSTKDAQPSLCWIEELKKINPKKAADYSA